MPLLKSCSQRLQSIELKSPQQDTRTISSDEISEESILSSNNPTIAHVIEESQRKENQETTDKAKPSKDIRNRGTSTPQKHQTAKVAVCIPGHLHAGFRNPPSHSKSIPNMIVFRCQESFQTQNRKKPKPG
jgi:hypothetical protein